MKKTCLPSQLKQDFASAIHRQKECGGNQKHPRKGLLNILCLFDEANIPLPVKDEGNDPKQEMVEVEKLLEQWQRKCADVEQDKVGLGKLLAQWQGKYASVERAKVQLEKKCVQLEHMCARFRQENLQIKAFVNSKMPPSGKRPRLN